MAGSNNVKEIIDTVFQGLDGFVSTKTVVGEPMQLGNATLIPLIEVSCGMGAGGFIQDKDRKNGNAGAGAMSSRLTPTAILILENGRSKLIHVKNQDMMSKLLDMIPDAIDKLTGGSRVSESAEKTAEEILERETEKEMDEKIRNFS